MQFNAAWRKKKDISKLVFPSMNTLLFEHKIPIHTLQDELAQNAVFRIALFYLLGNGMAMVSVCSCLMSYFCSARALKI
jgi:hypothetical protein